jgi:hypothetical protein
MNRFFKILILCLFLVMVLRCGVYGETIARNPLDWLNEMESDVFGVPTNGGIFDRLNQFELFLTGRTTDETLVERLSLLETLLYSNRPYDICLVYKLQALEWVLYREMLTGPLVSRLEKIETFLYNQSFSGPITKRLERLINQIFPDGTIKAKWVSVPEGLLVRVKTIDELSSKNSKAGDNFRFVVAETVLIDGFVVFPKGSSGVGVLREVKKPGNLGRDARLLMDFVKIRALDGSLIKISSSSKSFDENPSYQWAVGASAAGMLAFGPEGILFGLAVKGKECSIPVGTDFYLQISESVRVYTLQDDRR